MRITTIEAAKRLECSRETVERGLRAERFPFGEAVQNEKTGTWTYLCYSDALDDFLAHGKRQILQFNQKGVRTA